MRRVVAVALAGFASGSAACSGGDHASTRSFEVVSSGVSADLHALSFERGHVWAVGDAGTAIRWNGSDAFDPIVTNTASALRGIHDIAETHSADTDLWVVGLQSSGDYNAMHWSHGGWSHTDSPGVSLTATWGGTTMWAGSDDGHLIHNAGAGYSIVDPSTPLTAVTAIFGVAEDDLWATGGSRIVHWDGGAWTDGIGVPSAVSWNGVAGSASGDVWAVGDGGSIAHWNGSTWIGVPSATSENLRGVTAISPSDAWAVGDAGAIVHWDGMSWIGVPSATSATLFAVTGNGSQAWAAGAGGVVVRSVVP